MSRDWRVKELGPNDSFGRFQYLFYQDLYQFRKEDEEKKQLERKNNEKEQLLEMKKLDIEMTKLENEAGNQINQSQPFLWIFIFIMACAFFYLFVKILQKIDGRETRTQTESRDRRSVTMTTQI